MRLRERIFVFVTSLAGFAAGYIDTSFHIALYSVGGTATVYLPSYWWVELFLGLTALGCMGTAVWAIFGDEES